jgi:hypothetical protein
MKQKRASMKVMDRLARILAVVLLAVFAAGTIAHGASATSMSLAMSHDAMAGGDMGDCDGCPPGDDGKASLCGQVCLAPFAAIPAAVSIELPLVAAEMAASPLQEMVGRTGPPDPSPPRTIILN